LANIGAKLKSTIESWIATIVLVLDTVQPPFDFQKTLIAKFFCGVIILKIYVVSG
jgi:hypothetical protein